MTDGMRQLLLCDRYHQRNHEAGKLAFMIALRILSTAAEGLSESVQLQHYTR